MWALLKMFSYVNPLHFCAIPQIYFVLGVIYLLWPIVSTDSFSNFFNQRSEKMQKERKTIKSKQYFSP